MKSLIHISIYLNLWSKTIKNEIKNLKIKFFKNYILFFLILYIYIQNYYIYIYFEKIFIIIFHPFHGQVLICGSGVLQGYLKLKSEHKIARNFFLKD